MGMMRWRYTHLFYSQRNEAAYYEKSAYYRRSYGFADC